jgi:2-polyprenyl-3-methyl-5-hydroxy-6-metoxy-1,4-benzoquinol methylase
MKNLTELQKQHPFFTKLVDLISGQNPFQGKGIKAFILRQGPEYWVFAEKLCYMLDNALFQNDQDWIDAAKSYSGTCMEILREQIRFKKTGVYLNSDANAVAEKVYEQQKVMRPYIIGLMFTYLFWPNHYQMFWFFKEKIGTIKANRYLEVGVGHGLFTVETLKQYPELEAMLIDISQTSIDIAREILSAFKIDGSNVRFLNEDYLKASLPTAGYDFIVLGEVLEHVNDAPSFLSKANQLLHPEGSIFLSTCVNCPAIDHVFHFQTVAEIRELVFSSGLEIDSEMAIPAEDIPEEKWEDELVTVNYCAFLKK